MVDAAAVVRPPRRTGPRALAFARHHLLTVYGVLALGYLMLPVGVVVAFSFNDPAGKFNYTWKGFTLDNWAHPTGAPGIGEAVATSLQIAAIVTVVATILGTLIAMALVRYGFRGRGLTNFLIFMPISTPEIVFGISALVFFVEAGIPLGLKTILIAHVVFNASVVALVVRARFVGMGEELEEASYDLGAGPLATFRQVTLPRLAPAVLAGGLLAFTFSFDDFITSFFVSGAGTTTLPLRIFSALRFGISPVINATAVMILALTLASVVLAYVVLRRSGGGREGVPAVPGL